MKKLFFLLLLTTVYVVSTWAAKVQENISNPSDSVVMVAEKMPEFPGGQQALFKFLSDNVKYPVIAYENGIQGRVICQFIVDKDGSITNVEVIRSGGAVVLDNEAVRVINSMPRWTPGLIKGKPVRVKYTLPVNFRIEDNTKSFKTGPKYQVDSLFYNLGDNGQASVAGYVLGYQGAVTIPSQITYQKKKYKVTKIGSRAFSDGIGLTSITIPNSIEEIDVAAFRACTDLQSVTILGAISRIPKSAFQDCENLTQVLFLDGVKYFDDECFADCSALRSIWFPPSSYYIGKKAFANCSALTSIQIPGHVGKIGDDAFSGCTGLKSIVVDEDNVVYNSHNNCNAIINTLSGNLILGCENTQIPEDVKQILPNAFANNELLFSAKSRFATNSVDSIYGFTSKRASYLGGEVAMIQQLAEHLDLPAGLAKDFTGRTMIKAVVEKNGWVTFPTIAKSCGRADVDSAVLKAASYLSDYTPAKNDGEIVRSYTYIPASFPGIFVKMQNIATAKAMAFVLEKSTFTNDTVRLTHIPETGEVLYAGKTQTIHLACANPFLPTAMDTIDNWVETIHFEQTGMINPKARAERQNDVVKLVWTKHDVPTKDEYFRVLDERTMLKEKDVLYTRDGNLRHNFYIRGQLKRSILLNPQGDTISMWHKLLKGEIGEYVYYVDDYIQMVKSPYVNGKPIVKFGYRRPLGNEIVDPTVEKIDVVKIPKNLKTITEKFPLGVNGYMHSVDFKYENIVVYVYAVVGEDGRIVGDYKVAIKEADISTSSYPDKAVVEAICRQKAKIVQYVSDELAKQEINFVPGTVDGKATTMPCLVTIKLDERAIILSERLWAYGTSALPQTEEEWAEKIGLKFEVVEQMPEFPGGYEALLWYLRENVKYPVIAQENGIQGRVICSFVIDTEGSVVDVEVEETGGDASLDKEAKRVIKSMPKWKPGKNHGELVRVKYTVPVNFRLK